MKKYKVFDIEWDIDDPEFCNKCGGPGMPKAPTCKKCGGSGYEATPILPSEMVIELEDDEDPVECAADACTEKTGNLIISCKHKKWTKKITKRRRR